MKDELNDIDVLLVKLLVGEATDPEHRQVKDWLAESQANSDYYHHLKLIFESAGSAKVEQQFDADAAWMQVKAKLQTKKEKADQSLFALDWRIAAAIAAIIGVTALFYVTSDSTQSAITRVSAITETKNDTLPDGSSVFLNRKSQLSYSFDKKEKARKVKLSGEAFL